MGRANKAELRSRLRAVRRAIADVGPRSARIWETVTGFDEVCRARRVMLFHSIPGEPDTSGWAAWCRARDVEVAYPFDEPPPDPASFDVVVVPGIGFTAAGDRLGQGGGWYDRFLAGVRPGCLTVGVGFAEQLLDELPVEPHDVRLDRIVTA